MNLFVDDQIDLSKYFVATYNIKSTISLERAAWDIAIGQSVGNPNVRSVWETDELFENHSCKILHKREDLKVKQEGLIKIAFPVVNLDWETDGISQLLCHVMGGQMDIDHITTCQLLELDLGSVEHLIRPTFETGIKKIRSYTGQYNKPLLGGIIKPKTGISSQVLLNMVKELVEGGVDFIKEDEILGDPSFCKIEERIHQIGNYLDSSAKKVIYCVCINGDFLRLEKRINSILRNKGNGVHLNFWSGLGSYKEIRSINPNIFIHFQKSGDKVITGKNNPYRIDWKVICYLAGLMGVDTIHAGMYGGYLQDDSVELSNTINILHKYDVLPALSCGMHPGLVDKITRVFGPNYMANVGGAIHGHPGGTIAGAMAMRQAIDGNHGKEYNQAIEKWGSYVNTKIY